MYYEKIKLTGPAVFTFMRLGLITLAYFLAQVLAFRFPGSFGLVAAIWPAAGIALAALLLTPQRFWPQLLGCLFAAGLAANLTTDRPFMARVGFMLANICETAASAWLITWLCGDRVRFTRIRNVLALTIAATLINATTNPIKDETGAVVLALTHAVDITERKQAETERQTLNKLQSVGLLAGGIAHDFNNILQGLYGNISFAKEDLPKGHPSYASLEEAEKSMTRAVRLTKQLLIFAKGGAPVKEIFRLGDLAEEVARFDLSGSNVSLVYHHDPELWPVDADKGQLQQVISNLVINARQAMPDGGRLRVTLTNADLPAGTEAVSRPGRYVKVMVQDEGLGIDPAVLLRVFDPYFTTKQTGSGLGLATAWSVITKHGGHLGVVSELGKGTTFTFYLPAATAAPPVETAPPGQPSLNRPARILVMDDEASVCRIVTACGYSVNTAPGGQETMALYSQALADGTPFDVVIMDLTIPGGIGGQEAIKTLLALDPQGRAIVSSGYADDPVMAHYADYGFKATIAKPYTKRNLREVMARVLHPENVHPPS